jgi:hypothetical protein
VRSKKQQQALPSACRLNSKDILAGLHCDYSLEKRGRLRLVQYFPEHRTETEGRAG